MFDRFQKISRNSTFAVTMLEKWKKAVEKGVNVATLFMDLSKPFDTINHDLLLTKPSWYTTL